MNFDVMVLGLGAHGSSALYHLSKTGYKVCGIDRFAPPHSFGSSHGQSRIIRQAYHESPLYVPLVQEAWRLWQQLEKESGETLLLPTGGVLLGREDSQMITGAKQSADVHHLRYEYLHQEEIQKRFPAFKPKPETIAVAEQQAGILFPEKCIAAQLKSAAGNNALLLYNEVVTGIHPGEKCIEIITNKNRYETAGLVVSAGAWLGDLLPGLHLPLQVNRQVLFWFSNTNSFLQRNLLPDALPVYIWAYEKDKMFYGFPDLGDGIKIAFHHEGKPIHPDLLSKDVSHEEIQAMKAIVDEYLKIDAVFSHSDVCMYTNTPDEHFIIDHHPQHSNIIIASPCSGHGFKFSSCLGKILCDMALEKEVNFNLQPFSIKRFF